VNPLRDAASVGQPEAATLPESLNPLVGCFPADPPTTTLLGQPIFVSEKLLNESPSLFFVTANFPRHNALECYLCGEENV
jgi:hypothetical protein